MVAGSRFKKALPRERNNSEDSDNGNINPTMVNFMQIMIRFQTPSSDKDEESRLNKNMRKTKLSN